MDKEISVSFYRNTNLESAHKFNQFGKTLAKLGIVDAIEMMCSFSQRGYDSAMGHEYYFYGDPVPGIDVYVCVDNNFTSYGIV